VLAVELLLGWGADVCGLVRHFKGIFVQQCCAGTSCMLLITGNPELFWVRVLWDMGVTWLLKGWEPPQAGRRSSLQGRRCMHTTSAERPGVTASPMFSWAYTNSSNDFLWCGLMYPSPPVWFTSQPLLLAS